MALLLTLDASVFVSATHGAEASSAESRSLLHVIQERSVPLVEPTLLLAEVAAGIARGTQDRKRARAYVEILTRLPLITFVALNRVQAEAAAELAAAHLLRGADAIYVAAADLYGSRLVTLDREQRVRAPKFVKASTPAEVLKTLA